MSDEGLDEKIGKVEKVSKGAKGSSSIDLGEELESQRVAPNKDRFDSLMENPVHDSRRVDTSQVSLIDEVSNVSRKADMIRRASPQELVAQSQEVVLKIEELKDKLNTPNLELKSSVKDLLNNKLSHIDDN